MSNTDNDNGLHPLEGDRGVPSVNQRRGGGGKGWVFFIVIVLVIILAVLWTVVRLRKGAHDALTPSQKTQAQQQASKGFGGRNFGDEGPAPPPLLPAAPAPAPVPASTPEAIAVRPYMPPPVPAPIAQHSGPSLQDKAYDSPLIVDGGNDAGGGAGGVAGVAGLAGVAGVGGLQGAAAQAALQAAAQAGGNPNTGPLAGVLTSTKTAASVASVLQNRQFLMPKGTQIDCDLKTALSSDVPGMTSCVVTRNIYSDDGSTVLIERGSEVTGEYQSNMKQGQSRIFVLWNRVKSPSGVVVSLDSPGTDALGRSGLDGYVDNHWFERLGAAFMLSIVQDAIAYETAKAQSGGNGGTVFFQNSSQTGDQMASKILDSTINIPPTISKNQGERINIFVARDLDFSKVYGIQPQ
jgi:type IV secretion system protein VirB10